MSAALVVALAVAAVLVAVVWVLQPPAGGRDSAGPAPGAGVGEPPDDGSAGGGSTGDPGLVRADPGGDEPGTGVVVQPPIGRDPVLAEGGVRIDSYVARGDRLLVNYTTGVPECYGEVALAGVQERDDWVTVTLRSVPPPEPAEACIDLAVTGTLAVRLEALLGKRWVVDGSYDPLVLVGEAERPHVVPDDGR